MLFSKFDQGISFITISPAEHIYSFPPIIIWFYHVRMVFIINSFLASGESCHLLQTQFGPRSGTMEPWS